VLGLDDVAYPEARAALPVGAAVLLYTDGLIESRTDGPRAGMARLTQAVADCPGAEPAALLRAVLADALDHTTPNDDVALVVAQLLPVPAAVLEPLPEPPAPARPNGLEQCRKLRVEEHPDGSRTLRLIGELDLATIEPVRALVLHAVSACTGQVTIDTRDITYLGSPGVRLLAEAIQLANGRLRLSVQPGTVAEAHLSVCAFEGAGLSFQPPPRARLPRPVD
jgi:anti-anti-sigma factor